MAFQLDPNVFARAAQTRLSERLGDQKVAESQQGIASSQAEVAMNAEKMHQAKALRYLSMATPENWQSVRQQAISEGMGDEQTIPPAYDKAWVDNVTAHLSGAGKQQVPAAIQEFDRYKTMTPADQAEYLKVKRADQIINLGGTQVARSPNGTIAATFAVTPKPDQMPGFEGDVAAAKEAAKLKAESETKAGLGLPDAIASAETAIANIDGMIGNPDERSKEYPNGRPEHPGLTSAVGPISSKLPTLFDSTADFEARLDQALGGAFLEAYNSLKGGGAITEVEGAKATAAITRMKTATSEKAFREAAKEYRGIVAKGVERARARAGGVQGASPASIAPPPAGGKLIGTSGGKNVYQLPDGSHVMEQ